MTRFVYAYTAAEIPLTLLLFFYRLHCFFFAAYTAAYQLDNAIVETLDIHPRLFAPLVLRGVCQVKEPCIPP